MRRRVSVGEFKSDGQCKCTSLLVRDSVRWIEDTCLHKQNKVPSYMLPGVSCWYNTFDTFIRFDNGSVNRWPLLAQSLIVINAVSNTVMVGQSPCENQPH